MVEVGNLYVLKLKGAAPQWEFVYHSGNEVHCKEYPFSLNLFGVLIRLGEEDWSLVYHGPLQPGDEPSYILQRKL